jgi:hypothetical protein
MERMGERRRLLAAIAVIALGTILVAVVSFGLSRVDRSPTIVPSARASGDRPSARPIVSGVPANRAYLDASLAPSVADPLGPTTNHPLWLAGDRWWAALLDPLTGQTRLNRLTADGTAFQDTGRILDERAGAMTDALWDDGHLYVATAVRDRSVESGVRLTRYSPDPTTGFRPDPDFPIRLTDRGVRSMSLARDGAGRLWLAIVRDGSIQTAHTTTNDANWTPAAALAGAGPVADDDVAAVLSFGPGRIGVVWTSRATDSVHFAARNDGDPPDAWSAAETVSSGRPLLRDPIAAAPAADGSVLVSVAGDVRGSSASPDAARLTVARRDAAGTWTATVAGRVEDRHGPSAVRFDSGAAEIDVIATQQSTGSAWVLKRSVAARLEFESGLGAPLAVPAGVDQLDLGGPHLAAGMAPSSTALLVLGYDATLHRYVHLLLGPTSGEPGPSASGGPSQEPGGASHGPSGAPGGGPVTGLPLALIDDTFDVFAAGTRAPNGWELRTGDPADRVAVAPAAGHGNVLTLRSTASDNVRACKSFTPVSSGTLTATVRVRLGGIGTADATITSLRLHGSEAVLVRFGSGGTFAYYAGATKVRTSVAWKVGTWYQSTVRVDLARQTYDWQLAIEGTNAPIVRVAGIAYRDAAATAVDSVCVQTSSGRADLGLAIDRVTVTR